MMSVTDTESLSTLVTAVVMESVTDTESEKFFIVTVGKMVSVTDTESLMDLV